VQGSHKEYVIFCQNTILAAADAVASTGQNIHTIHINLC